MPIYPEESIDLWCIFSCFLPVSWFSVHQSRSNRHFSECSLVRCSCCLEAGIKKHKLWVDPVILTVQGSEARRLIAKKDAWKSFKITVLFTFLVPEVWFNSDCSICLQHVFLFTSFIPTRHRGGFSLALLGCVVLYSIYILLYIYISNQHTAMFY